MKSLETRLKGLTRIHLTIFILLWIIIGATGSIKTHLHYHENLTVGDLPVNIIGGGFTGPIAWLMYLSTVDTILIEQR